MSSKIINTITQDTIVLKKSQIQEYRTRLGKILQDIKINENYENGIINRLKSMRSKVENSNIIASERDLGRVLMAQRSRHNTINEMNEYDRLFLQLEQRYKEAYLLINEIRALFYGHITYSFGFILDGSVYEVQVSEQELFPLMQIQMVSRTQSFEKLFGLRIRAGAQLRQWKEQLEKDRGQTLLPLEGHSQELWDALVEMQPIAKVNDGYRYETYRRLILDGNFYSKNFIDENEKNSYLIKEMQKSRKNNLTWVRGGDNENEQDKFMNASVSSSTTLIKTIESILSDVFSDKAIADPQTMKRAVIKLFGEDSQFDSKVKSKAKQQAREILDEEIVKNFKDIQIII